MKQLSLLLLAGLGLLAAGCKLDNITPPGSQLTGRLTYQNQTLNVRGQDAIQLELWQRGEAFFNKIPVYVKQDGTYNATLFDGNYKMTRRRNNGPWQDLTDSIDVQVRGNTVIDVPMQPHFTIGTTTITKSGTNLVASCQVTKTGTLNIESATLYLSTTQFSDMFNQFANVSKNAADLTNLSQPVSLTLP
ncbi:MAG: DUF3823 domain-containing protein, partial [Hymenobacter sp.]